MNYTTHYILLSLKGVLSPKMTSIIYHHLPDVTYTHPHSPYSSRAYAQIRNGSTIQAESPRMLIVAIF